MTPSETKASRRGFKRPRWRSLAVVSGLAATIGFAEASPVSAQDAQLIRVLNLKDAALKLQREMTAEEVVGAAKANPTWVSIDTCGSNTSAPWQCKIYHYDVVSHYKVAHELNVYFYQDAQSVWRVHDWSAY